MKHTFHWNDKRRRLAIVAHAAANPEGFFYGLCAGSVLLVMMVVVILVVVIFSKNNQEGGEGCPP